MAAWTLTTYVDLPDQFDQAAFEAAVREALAQQGGSLYEIDYNQGEGP